MTDLERFGRHVGELHAVEFFAWMRASGLDRWIQPQWTFADVSMPRETGTFRFSSAFIVRSQRDCNDILRSAASSA